MHLPRTFAGIMVAVVFATSGITSMTCSASEQDRVQLESQTIPLSRALTSAGADLVSALKAAQRGEHHSFRELYQLLIQRPDQAMTIGNRQWRWIRALAHLDINAEQLSEFAQVPHPAQLLWYLSLPAQSHQARHADQLSEIFTSAIEHSVLTARDTGDQVMTALLAESALFVTHIEATYSSTPVSPRLVRLPPLGPLQPITRALPTQTLMSQAWASERGLLLALDPWGQCAWQVPLAGQALVAHNVHYAVLQEWTRLTIIDRNNQRLNLHLPPDFSIIGLSNHKLWAQRGSELWSWNLIKERLQRSNFNHPALAAPIIADNGDELWCLDDHWLILRNDGTEERFAHGLDPNKSVELRMIAEQLFIRQSDNLWRMSGKQLSAWELALASQDPQRLASTWLSQKPTDPIDGDSQQQLIEAAITVGSEDILDQFASSLSAEQILAKLWLKARIGSLWKTSPSNELITQARLFPDYRLPANVLGVNDSSGIKHDLYAANITLDHEMLNNAKIALQRANNNLSISAQVDANTIWQGIWPANKQAFSQQAAIRKDLVIVAEGFNTFSVHSLRTGQRYKQFASPKAFRIEECLGCIGLELLLFKDKSGDTYLLRDDGTITKNNSIAIEHLE